MAKKYTKSDDLTRYLYETSEYQLKYQQTNQANVQGDHQPAELGKAAFPPLNGVAGEDKNRDVIPPVSAPGTETEVLKGESNSSPPCENPDEPSEDRSTNAAAAQANSDLDAGKVSAEIESIASTSAEHITMSITRQLNTDPICNHIFDVPYRDSDQGVEVSDPKLLPPASGSSSQQSEDLQRGTISSSPTEGVMTSDADLQQQQQASSGNAENLEQGLQGQPSMPPIIYPGPGNELRNLPVAVWCSGCKGYYELYKK